MRNRKHKFAIRLSYGDPLIAVLLRKLAWESYYAKPIKQVKDITGTLTNFARRELGFNPVTRGPAEDFYRDKLKRRCIDNETLSPADAAWQNAWRLLNLPSHFLVRILSDDPIVTAATTPTDNHIEYAVALRDTAMPRLKVFIGTKKPSGKIFEDNRGIYFLRLQKQFYIGKSDECNVRIGQHLSGKYKDALWWAFIAPEIDNKTFTLDALGASESMMISFWNEICKLANGKAGLDKEPAFAYLQQAILFVTAASAVMVWLMRENPASGLEINLGNSDALFIKPSRSSGKDWPNCYLMPPATK